MAAGTRKAPEDPPDLGILLTASLRGFVDLLHAQLGAQGYADVRPAFGVVFRALRDGPLTLIVSASILGFDGQISTFVPFEGPCYRCLYPTPPPAELAPSCSANGVLGVMAGTMGTLQANEVIKLVLGIGEPLIGRLLLYDALGTRFTELKVRRDPDCPICGENAEEIPESEMGQFPDYELFCAGAGGDR